MSARPFDSLPMSAPFELAPTWPQEKKRIAILIHGFLASPYILRDLALIYQDQGYWVKAICLKGHGTQPENLDTVRTADWIGDLEQAITESKDFDEIHLCGYSLGACLAGLASFSHTIHSLCLISPAFGLNAQAHLLPYLNAYFPNYLLENDPIRDDASYHRFTVSAAHQVYQAVMQLQSELEKNPLSTPCFMALSAQDATIDASKALQEFKRSSSPHSRLRLYDRGQKNNHQDPRIQRITPPIVSSPEDPWHQVRELSHICLPIAPQNPYYGKQGNFQKPPSPGTILGEPRLFRTHWRGFRRLTFNPDFSGMTESLVGFLNQVSGKTS